MMAIIIAVLLLCLASMPVHTDVSNSKQFMTQKEQNILAFPAFQHLFKPKGLQISLRRSEGAVDRGYFMVEPILQWGGKPKSPRNDPCCFNSHNYQRKTNSGSQEKSIIFLSGISHIYVNLCVPLQRLTQIFDGLFSILYSVMFKAFSTPYPRFRPELQSFVIFMISRGYSRL